MGLETATYIGGLTPAWPLATDTKSQGDDHLRLLKQTLQATFPTATRAFYFPTVEVVSALISLDATDQNNTLYVDTSSGSVTVNLPSGFGTNEKGWQCTVVKTSTDANAAIVTPASGTIYSKVGSTATIRVGCAVEPAIFEWTGSAWICYKPGAVIGEVISFDGLTTPPGFLDADGGVYSNTAFAELFAVLASTTLRDRRGRTDIGSGTGSGLTNRVAGTQYGVETHPLVAAEIPSLTSTNPSQAITVNAPGGNNFIFGTGVAQANTQTGPNQIWHPLNAVGNISGVSGNNAISVTSSGTLGTAHQNMQPSIAAKKIIRAC
jgi:hypothetical protein